ncbi:thymidine kinase [Alkaliphilus sp. B6464]|uniref:thymidine kinase n=1 Tax=Alkaliphilus sp. B6464 TaxID=2731219 RepID=UPI001BA87285|nr:thymidine kinase [Alkaliphilus sp. B6464]QUH21953.1 thymidine kinase [Alkaliphilus sp. B6464]
MNFYDGKSGFITVITGPMFAEKSGELVNRCKKEEKYGGKKVIAFKPSNDNRFSDDEIVSRLGLKMEAVSINKIIDKELEKEILKTSEGYDIVAFDEVQFFDDKIVDVVFEIAYRGSHVIVAGLDLDFRARPFGYTGDLMAISDKIVKKTAYCACCGRPAQFTQRLVDALPAEDGPIELIGDKESYEPRCRSCFVPPHKVREYNKAVIDV